MRFRLNAERTHVPHAEFCHRIRTWYENESPRLRVPVSRHVQHRHCTPNRDPILEAPPSNTFSLNRGVIPKNCSLHYIMDHGTTNVPLIGISSVTTATHLTASLTASLLVASSAYLREVPSPLLTYGPATMPVTRTLPYSIANGVSTFTPHHPFPP